MGQSYHLDMTTISLLLIEFVNDHFGVIMYSSLENVCYSSYNNEQNFDFLASDFLLFLPLLLLLGVGE